jgi:FkbM family methyltransferase
MPMRSLEQVLRPLLKRISFPRTLRMKGGRLRLWVSPGSDWRFLRPDWQHAGYSELVDVAETWVRSGMRVWDIGANVGVFTFAALQRVGKEGSVTAIEPDPTLSAMIAHSRHANLRREGLNPHGPKVLTLALNDVQGVLDLVIPINGSARNHLASVTGNSADGEYDRRATVALTADWLQQHVGRPDFIKIDVEGAEVSLLHGAAEVLSKARPLVYIEVNEENTEAVTRLLGTHRYLLFDYAGGSWKPTERCAFNTLAVPAERLDEHPSLPRRTGAAAKREAQPERVAQTEAR